MIKHLEENENLKDIVSNGTYLVDFYATWCGPCKMLGSVLPELKDIEVIKVDVDMHHDLAVSYGVMSVPTMIFFKDGKEVRKEIGFRDIEELNEIVKSL